VFKVPLLVALHRAADAGRLRFDQRTKVVAGGRTSGVSGLGAMHDDAELSLRDLALLMITVSDNAAADAVLDHVGLDADDETLRSLGLTRTRVVATSGDLNGAPADDVVRAGRGRRLPGARSGDVQPQHPARHDHVARPHLARRGGEPGGLWGDAAGAAAPAPAASVPLAASPSVRSAQVRENGDLVG